MAEHPNITLPRRAQDLTGRRFGRLVAVSYAGKRGQQSLWLCRCECGEDRVAFATNLLRSLTKSCGCLKGEGVLHAKSLSKFKSEYNSYRAMLNRCLRPETDGYNRYGGRGIGVCDRWKNSNASGTGFDCFLEDMGPKPAAGMTIERRDTNMDYSPDNCLWETMRKQQNNKRNTVFITAGGVTMTVGEWAEKTGIAAFTIRARIRRGWTPERAIRPQ